MINPNFDPYEILMELKNSTLKISQNQQEMAQHISQQADHIKQMTTVINNQHRLLINLGQRIDQLENGHNHMGFPK